MISQQLLRFHNQIVKQSRRFFRFGAKSLNQVRTERFKRYIVRRHASHVFISTFYNQQMAILHSGIKMHLITSQLLFQILYKHIGIFGRYMSGRVILQQLTFHTYQITPHSHIIGLQINSYAGSLKYSPSLVNGRKVVAHYRHIGYFASGMKPIGYSLQHTCFSHLSQSIHIRSISVLQQGLVSQ